MKIYVLLKYENLWNSFREPVAITDDIDKALEWEEIGTNTYMECIINDFNSFENLEEFNKTLEIW